MNESMWEKINIIRKVHSHNTTNESPILAPPTVSIIVVNQPSQQQLQQQQQQQQQQFQLHPSQVMNNNNNFGFPNMGFNSPSPMINMYNQQPNYAVLAAAQSILSAAANNYNAMYSQPFIPPRMLHPTNPYNMAYVPSPQMMQRPTPTPTPIQQQNYHHPQYAPQSPPPSSSNPNLIKRKPVRSTERQTMSPQIQQRLSRRKSAPAVVEKKKVRFKDEPTVYYIESNNNNSGEIESDDDEYRTWKGNDRRIRKFSQHQQQQQQQAYHHDWDSLY